MRSKQALAATAITLALLVASCGSADNSVEQAAQAASPTTAETPTTELETTTTSEPTTTTADDDADTNLDEENDEASTKTGDDKAKNDDEAGADDADKEEADAEADIDGADADDEDSDTDDEDADDVDADDDADIDEADAEEAEDDETDQVVTDTEAKQLLLKAPPERGDNNETVTVLQAKLVETGFATGEPDGDFGPATERSIAAFQRVAGLPHTGRINDRTVEALYDFDYDGPVLAADGSNNEKDVIALQKRLAAHNFDPGPADGDYGTKTIQAIWALEKLAGISVDGDWGPADEWALQKLETSEIARPSQSHDVRWVEVDLNEQVARVYDPGSTTPVLISHVSSGSGQAWSNGEFSGSSVTPTGDYTITRRVSGWRESSLNIGRLYNPLYFNGGIAFHGATSVPLYPASHGCIRVPMHIADYLPAELPNGTPVHIYR